jgi:hypothetical protein
MFAIILPTAIMLVPLLLLAAALEIWKKRNKHFKRRNPLTRNLLRSPGETLRGELDEISLDIGAHLAITPAIPAVMYASYLNSPQLHSGSSTLTAIILGLFAALGLVYVFIKLTRLIRKRRKLAIGLDAELAVAQELNELMLYGHRVFHDFPAEGFNIDHIVVGETGVYAVETKGRTKPVSDEGQASWEVSYDGRTLAFPGWHEARPLEQAKDQASWLQEWLTKAVGESVSVKPALALPGWYVKRTAPGGIWVCNGKKMETLLKYAEGAPLSPKLVQQIAHQIEQRCRDVEPTLKTG